MNHIKNSTVIFDLKYGDDISQKGHLYIPNAKIKGTICLFHGGFWKMPYDLRQFDKLCESLLLEGFIVWNIEYRRTGEPNSSWIAPFEDAVKSVNHLIKLKKDYSQIDEKNVIIMGHSAGGHLALWLGHNNHITEEKLKLNPIYILGLAPITDLVECYNNSVGGNAVEELLQCTPTSNLSRYIQTSPIVLLPLKRPTIIFHGTKDEYVPIKMTKTFSDKCDSYSKLFSLIEINGGTHMDFIDPNSRSTQKVIEVLNDIIFGKK